MNIIVPNRRAAGQALARRLLEQAYPRDALILALPRGGVPVAYEIAMALDAELDLLIVRKLGMPREPEVAMGAIASGAVQFLHNDLIASHNISHQQIARVIRDERDELERRERLYRGARSESSMKGRTVVLVDDGLATGASMRVAVDAARQRGAARIAIAVPVAAVQPLDHLSQLVNDVVCLVTPVPFFSVSQWYREFPQVSDDEVQLLLNKAWTRHLTTKKAV